jgi:hypothetical protein
MSQLDTGSGFIQGQGVEPAQPRTAADVQAPPPQPGQNGPLVIVQGGQTGPGPTPQNGRFYSEEDVARMREETDGRLAEMQAQLQQLTTDREEREAAAQAERDRLAQEARQASEAEMDVRTLLETRDKEWNQRIEAIEEQRQRDQAIFEREREWNELQNYRRARIEQEEQLLLPDLRDLIQGNTVGEIDQAIEDMKQRTQTIAANFREAMTDARPLARGAALTGQPSMGGPMEQQPGVEQISIQDIKGMDNKTYGQYRDRLMRYATQSGQAPPQ